MPSNDWRSVEASPSKSDGSHSQGASARARNPTGAIVATVTPLLAKTAPGKTEKRYQLIHQLIHQLARLPSSQLCTPTRFNLRFWKKKTSTWLQGMRFLPKICDSWWIKTLAMPVRERMSATKILIFRVILRYLSGNLHAWSNSCCVFSHETFLMILMEWFWWELLKENNHGG